MRATLSVLIAGAGPVGLTFAALLLCGRYGHRVEVRVLEERARPSWDPGRVDLRVYALSRAAQRILERIEVWPALRAARLAPYRCMRVWQGPSPEGFGALTFDSADLAEPDLGHIVEDALLRASLLERIEGHPGLKLAWGDPVEALEVAPRGLEVITASGKKLTADVLVAADGSDSRMRMLSGLRASNRLYGQHAVVAHVASERSHEETAWQRFLPTGPLAFLPLQNGLSSVVWSTASDRAVELVRASRDDFLAALGDASGGVLGRLTLASERASFALRMLHAHRYCAPRVALAGDAAHTVHPLAGQGMNLGLLDAAVLAEQIEGALQSGEDPGDLRVLRRYERKRKGENLAMLLALDAIHRLFRMPPGLDALGALALGVVDASETAKALLMRRALGLSGELPAAASVRLA